MLLGFFKIVIECVLDLSENSALYEDPTYMNETIFSENPSNIGYWFYYIFQFPIIYKMAKFLFLQKTVQTVERENASKENVNNGVGQFIYSNIINLWGNTWWRSFIPYGDANSSIDKNKPN